MSRWYPLNMQRDFELEGRLVPGLVTVWGIWSIPEILNGIRNRLRRCWTVRPMFTMWSIRCSNRKGSMFGYACRGVLKRNEEGEPVIFAGVVTDLGKGKIDYTTGLFTNRECEKEVGRIFDSEENMQRRNSASGSGRFRENQRFEQPYLWRCRTAPVCTERSAASSASEAPYTGLTAMSSPSFIPARGSGTAGVVSEDTCILQPAP